MIDGFHWTRALSKQLRFLCEEVALLPVPQRLKALAEAADRMLAAQANPDASPAADPASGAAPAAEALPAAVGAIEHIDEQVGLVHSCGIEADAALRNQEPADGVVPSKGISR